MNVGNNLDKIPAFWAFIGGSLVTLLVFFLTNRFTNQRLQTQLAHDRDLRNREREMTLRKEIYLAATEAASAGLIAVGRFANLTLNDEQLLQGYVEKAPAVMKVHIIAKEETVGAVVSFSVELSASFLRLSAKRMPLVMQKQQIEMLRAQHDASLKDNARTLEMQRQYNIEGASDPRRWDVLQQNFEFERDRGERARQEADALSASLIPQHLQLLQEVFDDTITLGRLLTPALLSIRRELELPLDETEFRRISEEAIARQAESLEEFMRQIRSLSGGAPSPAA